MNRTSRPATLNRKLTALALPALIALAACESMFQARAAQDHPPPGEMVEIDGDRRIQLDCRGEGQPTVVFQSGGDVLGALAWRPVHDQVAQFTRACAYSRAGMLWSDPARGAFTPREVAEDLHAALTNAGESGEYVLVGHSRGGLYNMIYAGLYQGEIAGLVFADSSHPDQEEEFAGAGMPIGNYVSPAQELGLAFRWTGLMRMVDYPVDASISEEVEAFYPKSAAANAREARARHDTLELAGKFRDLRDWPVVVLAREPAELTQAWKREDSRNAYLLSADGLATGEDLPAAEIVWRRLQADLATWSSRARLQVVPESGHAFFFYQPEVIVAAVKEVVTAARVVHREPPLPN